MVTGERVCRGAGSGPVCRRRTHAEIRGCAPTSRQVPRISHGATFSKTVDGSPSSSAAPTTEPTLQVTTTRRLTAGCSDSSAR